MKGPVGWRHLAVEPYRWFLFSLLEPLQRLRARRWREPVTIGIATVPEREAWFEEVARRFLDCEGVRLVVYRSRPGEPGDHGSSGKFLSAESCPEGYFLTIDDDIAYPPEYIPSLLAGIERHRRRAVVTYHGTIYPSLPVPSLYARGIPRVVLSFERMLLRDTRVHLGGTGCMGFHTSLFRPSMDFFEMPNMADVWLSVRCRQASIPIVCLRRPRDWLTSLGRRTESTIYSRALRDDSVQTRIFNSNGPWPRLRLPFRLGGRDYL